MRNPVLVINGKMMGIPDELMDIFDIDEELNEKDADSVYNSLSAINQMILVDNDLSMNNVSLVNGSHTYNIIEMSLKVIENLTNVEYLNKVFDIFYLDLFFERKKV